MSSQAQIHANRENSQLSTGPRSDTGKAASSRNATSHGLSSAEPVLPCEDMSNYLVLLNSYIAEFSPSTPHEEFLVSQMVSARWRLDRVQRMENAFLEGMLDETTNPYAQLVRALLEKDIDPLTRLDRYRTSFERTYQRCVRELRATRKFQNEANRVVKPQQPAAQPIKPQPVSVRSVPAPHPQTPTTTSDWKRNIEYAETNPALRL